VGFDLSYALSREEALTASELDALAEHLLRWRTKIVGYDWQVPRADGARPLVAWGTLRPTRGNPKVSDHGGYLADVVEHLHEALAEVRDLIRNAKLAFADDFGALAWMGTRFSHSPDAPSPDQPRDESTWASLSELRAIPDGKAAREALKAGQEAKPKTKSAAVAALEGADQSKLIDIVLSELNSKVSDRERSAAVELLGGHSDSRAAAALVARLRQDGFERPWTRAALGALAAPRGRCSWATALLAFDRHWPGAALLLATTITNAAVPYIARLPPTQLWSALALRSLDALATDAARAARRELTKRLRDSAVDTTIIDAIVSATDAQANAVFDGKKPKPPIAALPALFDERPTRLADDMQRELWQIESDWLTSNGLH
jgi:hypothetical protein